MTADPFAWPEDARIAALRTDLAAAQATIAAIVVACGLACHPRRHGTPTFGLVSAARIAAIVEEASQ